MTEFFIITKEEADEIHRLAWRYHRSDYAVAYDPIEGCKYKHRCYDEMQDYYTYLYEKYGRDPSKPWSFDVETGKVTLDDS